MVKSSAFVTAAALAGSASARSVLPRQGGSDCDCFATNGTSADYYTHYRFFDFRNIQDVPDVPDTIKADAKDRGEYAASQGGYVNSTEFSKFWTTETFVYEKSADDTAKYDAQSSMANVFVQPKDSYGGDYSDDPPSDDASTWLTLRTSRPDKKFATMSQLTSKDVYVYGTMRFAGRVVGPTGACAGFFSYALEDGDNNEADIEILTKDDDYADAQEVHYTNQPSDVNGEDSGTSRNDTLATPFYRWQTHRFDWRESGTDFYADGGKHKMSIDRNIPKGDSQLTLNMWSTGNDWTDSLAVGEEAEYQILWIEWAYNTTDTESATCSNVCQLDDPEVDSLSPSKFAEDSAGSNDNGHPVAIPTQVDLGTGNVSNTSMTSSSPTPTPTGNGSSRLAMGSSLLAGAGLLASFAWL